jgi:hypothetical protein
MAHAQTIPPPKDPFKTEPVPAPEKKKEEAAVLGPPAFPSGTILSVSFNQIVNVPGVGQHMTASVERAMGQAESNILSLEPWGPQGLLGLAMRVRNKHETFVVPWTNVAVLRVKP